MKIPEDIAKQTNVIFVHFRPCHQRQQQQYRLGWHPLTVVPHRPGPVMPAPLGSARGTQTRLMGKNL